MLIDDNVQRVSNSTLASFQDPFKYSYPPLPDDDFQTPVCENGPIPSEDDNESKEEESECKDTLEASFSSEVAVKPKKVQRHLRLVSNSYSFLLFLLIDGVDTAWKTADMLFIIADIQAHYLIHAWSHSWDGTSS